MTATADAGTVPSPTAAEARRRRAVRTYAEPVPRAERGRADRPGRTTDDRADRTTDDRADRADRATDDRADRAADNRADPAAGADRADRTTDDRHGADPYRLPDALQGVVTHLEVFLAPLRHGPDSPEALRVLLDAVHPALGTLLDPTLAPPPGPVPPGPAPIPPRTGSTGSVDAPSGATGDGAPTPSAPTAGPAPGDASAAGRTTGGEGGGTTGDPSPAEEAAEAAPGTELRPDVELVMPAAPAAPGPRARGRASAVAADARTTGDAARDLPTAEENVADARGAVTEPAAETAARAREELTAELGGAPAPHPRIVALADRIVRAIEESRPHDEDELLGHDPTVEARRAGETVSASVSGGVDEAGAGYDALAAPPAGRPALQPTPVPAQDPSSPGPSVDAASAAPDPIPAEDLSLDGDVAATDERIAAAGIDTPVTRVIPDGPSADARAGREALGELAGRTPAELEAEQADAIGRARTDMADLQLRAVAAVRAARAGTVGAVSTAQTTAVGTEELTREAVSGRANDVFERTRAAVETLLEPLTRTAMTRWTTGLELQSTRFDTALARVQRWIEERHSGTLGAIVAIGDYITGLPGWVTDEYVRAERAFGRGVADLLLEISTEVEGVLAAARVLVRAAEREIDQLFTAMEAELPGWAAAERARYAGMLGGLTARVDAAGTAFVDDLSTRAVTAVGEARAAVEARRAEARGLVGQVLDAVARFIEDPVRAVIDGLLSLAGIPPADFWALVSRIEQVVADIAADPLGFVNNLVAGVRLGFEAFFDDIGTHLVHGLWTWLFSRLDTPIRFPTDLSARGLVTFALELMGITWPRVREILVRHVGAEAVEIVETAWELITTLVERGPEGIAEMVGERLRPEDLVGIVLDAAVEYVVQTLIEQVVVRVVAMLNPAGAIVQALDLLYRVGAWIFRNAARIFRFVEAVVNGAADVVAGNVAGLATKVEKALGMLVPPVIDFLAGIMHLGDLPDRVADVIVSLQERVLAVVERLIVALVARGRALLRRLGVGGAEEGAEEGSGEQGGDTELGTTVRFRGAGEQHRTWVDTAGQEATLMVASVPEAIVTRIARWRARLTGDESVDEELRAEAASSLGNLETMVTGADAEADRLARLFLELTHRDDPTAAPPSDDALENLQRAIAGLLARLFEILEGEDGAGQTATWLADMADRLPGDATDAMSTPYAEWARRIPTFGIGNEPDDERLWTDDVLDGTRREAEEYIARQPTHRLLLPWFQSAPGDRAVDSGPFRHHVFIDRGGPVLRPFRTGYGEAAVLALRTQAAARLGASTRVDDTYKERLRRRIDAMAFDWASAGGGRIIFPTERPPDHTRYTPLDVTTVEAGGIRTVTYRTVTGQTFVSTKDTRDGLTMNVVGRNLRFMTGRGETHRASAYTSGNDFNSSHIIANEVGGSGLRAGANLVTASRHFNQEVMRKEELAIREAVTGHAAAHGLDVTEVSFTLDVTVRFGLLRDPVALAQAKQAPTFPADRVEADLDAEILARIKAGRVVPGLLRIMDVVYTWEYTDPPGPRRSSEPTGADVWLLTH